MPAGAGAFSKGGFYAEGSSIWKGRYRKVHSDFQPGGGVCGHGKKSDPDRVRSKSGFHHQSSWWRTSPAGDELYEGRR